MGSGIGAGFCGGGALAVEPDFGGGFHAGEHVVDRLAAEADEVGSDDEGDEIGWGVDDLLGGSAVESPAEDGGHGAGEGLHLWAEGDAEEAAVGGVDAEKDSDGIGAFLVLADVFEVERFAFLRGLAAGSVREADEHFASF